MTNANIDFSQKIYEGPKNCVLIFIQHWTLAKFRKDLGDVASVELGEGCLLQRDTVMLEMRFKIIMRTSVSCQKLVTWSVVLMLTPL